MRNTRPGFFTAEGKLHNIFLNSETVCCYEASFMTCSIFSLNNAEAGSWRWDETQALDKDLGGPGADSVLGFQLVHLSSTLLEDQPSRMNVWEETIIILHLEK